MSCWTGYSCWRGVLLILIFRHTTGRSRLLKTSLRASVVLTSKNDLCISMLCKSCLLCSPNRYKNKALFQSHDMLGCYILNSLSRCNVVILWLLFGEMRCCFVGFFFVLCWGKSKFLFTFTVLEIPIVSEESESFMGHWRILTRLCAMGMQWKWMAFSSSSHLKFCLDSPSSGATLTATGYHFS